MEVRLGFLAKKQSEQLEQTQNEIIKTDIKNCKGNTKTSITYGNINYPNKIPNSYKANGISTQVIRMRDNRIQKTIYTIKYYSQNSTRNLCQ